MSAHAKHDAHANPQGHGAEAHGAHPPHKEHKAHAHDLPPGTPPWLISFGDMMTLFLCFFIMLVTRSATQDAGLIAEGLGPFVAALEGSGMDGALSGEETLQRVNVYRERFGLAPLTDSEYLTGAAEMKDSRLIEQIIKDSLRPYAAMNQPMVASFAAGSAELSPTARRYLDLLAETLRPGLGQVLVLEGHANDAAEAFANDDGWLAAERAQAVKVYLLEEHSFVPTRVEARAWPLELKPIGSSFSSVDARLIQPIDKPQG
jgi:chemotaxis protein MotB